MEIDLNYFTVFWTAVFFLFLYLWIFLIRIFAGKSLTSSEYPPVKGTIYGLLFHASNLYDYQTEMAKKHRTFRLLAAGHSEIFTTDPKNVEHITKIKFDNYVIGEHNREYTRDFIGEGIFAADGDNWRHQRKLASYEFSTRVLREFSCSVFRKETANFVQIVSEFSGLGQVFDLQDLFLRYTLASIVKVGFGLDLDCLENSSKESSELMKAIDNASESLAMRYLNPLWKLFRLFGIGYEACIKNSVRIINSALFGMMAKKRKLLHQRNINDKEDILSRFLVESEKNPTKMNDNYLRDIIVSFMVAGKDTSGSALCWFFYMLCKNPLIQQKIAQEVKEAVGIEGDEEEIGINAFMENLTDKALDKMHYLHAAITETLRLYPSIARLGARIAQNDDILPDGYRVKKGDVVWYLAYAMGRMTYLWGQDADQFKPERWLKNGIFQPESPYKLVAFAAGPRICLGRDFAYREMKILSAALIHFFRFKLADETNNITYRVTITLAMDGGLPVLAIPRRTIA